MEEKKPIWETFEITFPKNFKEECDFYNYQQYATYLSLNQPSYVCGLQTGLGKTLCAYASYYYYKEKFPNTKLIVVSNKSAVIQLHEEVYKFFKVSERGVAIHRFMERNKGEKYADSRKRIFEFFKDTSSNGLDILWMNYTIFRMHVKDIEKAILSFRLKGWHNFIVYDESTSFMNMGTDTYRAVRRISKLSNKVCVLTATVSKGKLEQIYSIFKAMNIELFPNKRLFENRYCIIWQHPKNHFIKKIQGYQNVQELVELVRPYIIVLRKVDVASQLPAFTISKTYLEHSEEQIKLINGVYTGDIDISMYKQRGDSLRVEDKEGNLTKALKASIETNFIKVALLDERLIGRKKDISSRMLSPKTEEIIRTLEEDCIDEKIVVYTHSKQYLKLMAKTVRNNKRVPNNYKKVLEICGDVNMLDRDRYKKMFSETSDHNLIFINKAGMESLNLQAANTIIVTTMPDDFGGLTQLAGRISRIDTKHKNLYLKFLLMKDSQDEDEYMIIMQQGVLMKNLIDEPEEGLIDYSVLIKDTDLSKEEYQHRSLSSLIFKVRSRRAQKYKRLLKGLK